MVEVLRFLRKVTLSAIRAVTAFLLGEYGDQSSVPNLIDLVFDSIIAIFSGRKK